MEHLDRLQGPSHAAKEDASRVRAMIADLDRVIEILDSDIATEEERSGIYDPANVEYPILARTIMGRRENLKATIAVLEATVESMNANALLGESPRTVNTKLRSPPRNASARRFEAWLRLTKPVECEPAV
ncbi:MAG TPA: hypothetical protein VGL45_19785 [Bradyrhizobium sp.]